MTRLVMLVLFISGVYYLTAVRGKTKPPEPPPRPPVLGAPAAVTPALSIEDLERIRLATRDSSPAVRWGAVELLYSLDDPDADKILENMLTLDTEPQVRRNALNILRRSKSPEATKDLVLALRDPERDIRVAALVALADVGSPDAAPEVVRMLNDQEADVRLQALHTLRRFQETRKQEYQNLYQNLKKAYEDALKKSQAEAARR